jgi:hypothetical protein
MTQTIVNAFVLCLMAHMVGDYVIQSDWMATQKTKSPLVALIHGLTYGIPFLPVVQLAPWPAYAWLTLTLTHAVIDHFSLARHLVWFKNQLAPYAYRPPHTATGHGLDRPDWLAVWLVIIVDNLVHMAINVASVVWL